jgi:hypothetical protein
MHYTRKKKNTVVKEPRFCQLPAIYNGIFFKEDANDFRKF